MMKITAGQGAENRVLQGEIALHQGLEHRYLAQAAVAAAEGDMDAFSWAMDVSRTAGRDAEAIQTITAPRDIPVVEIETSKLMNFGAINRTTVTPNEVATLDYLPVLDAIPPDSTAFKHYDA